MILALAVMSLLFGVAALLLYRTFASPDGFRAQSDVGFLREDLQGRVVLQARPCESTTISRFVLERRDTGTIVFEASLRDGAVPRMEMSVDGAPDPDYQKVLFEPLQAGVVYEEAVLLDAEGEPMNTWPASFRMDLLTGDGVVHAVWWDGEVRSDDLARFMAIPGRCE